MLTDCTSLPSSDLWQLGVTIYRMHTGEFPFSSRIEANIFQKILSLDFSWPQNIEICAEAKDLVERLLKIKPQDRLGAGGPDSPNNIKILMQHPYFESIDFANLLSTKVPLQLP